MKLTASVCHSRHRFWMIAAAVTLMSAIAVPAAAQTLTWDANTGANGVQNTDGTTNTLIWNTSNNNWWNGTANESWVNGTSAIAQIGFPSNPAVTANVISITEDIVLKELRFMAVTTGSIATGQQYSLNGSAAGRILDFGTGGVISLEERSSGGSQFTNLGANLRLKGQDLSIRKYGSGLTMQFFTLSMTTNPELTGTFTVGGAIYANVASPLAIDNVSRVIVEAGGSFVSNTAGANYDMPFTLAGFGNGLSFTGSAYGAIRALLNNLQFSGGILLSADAGINTSSSGTNATGVLISAPITDDGKNYAFHRFAFRGDGTLTMAAANTYGGATVLGRAGGTGSVTILDFTAGTSPQDDILYSGLTTPGPLNIMGGIAATVLRLTGKPGETHSQRFGNVSVAGTQSVLELLPGAGGTMNVSLGSFSRADATSTLSIVAPQFGSGTVTTTHATGFIGPWLSYTANDGSRSWARSAGGALATGYTGDVAYATGASLGVAPYVTGTNVGITSLSTGPVGVMVGTAFLNTLSMADVVAERVVQAASGSILRVQGGIQLVNGARALTFTGGSLSAGSTANNTAGQLLLSNHSATEALTVNSSIVNNGSGGVLLIVQGAPGSRTVLTGTNTHSGGTQISSGILEIRSPGALGTTGTVTIVENGGGTLALSGGITLNRALAAVSGNGDGNNGAIRSLSGNNTISALITQQSPTLITADAGASLTISAATAATNAIDGGYALTFGGAGNITVTGRLAVGAGLLTKIGTGTVLLSGDNTFTGGTIVSGGILKLGSGTALGGVSTAPAVTVTAGGTLDLNGQTVTNRAYTFNGTGAGSGGALINSASGTTATISGATTALGTVLINSATVMGGVGNITIDNLTGITGNFLLTKIGSGTLSFIDNTTTSARTGVNQIDAGTLRVQSTLAISPVGTGAYALNGGTLSLGFDLANTLSNLVNVISSSTILADRATAGAGATTTTLGAVTIGGSTLTVKAGANITSGNASLTLGAVTIGGVALRPGNPTFDVQSSASATTSLTMAALSDQAIAPRTLTFQNSGTAASIITLTTAATSLVDGTVVNVGATGAPLTLNLSSATALGALARVTVGSGSTLTIPAATTFGSLAGGGTLSGAFTLTVGNLANVSPLSTTFSGVLSSGMALTKTGLGTLTLSGANAYNAATTVTAGILQLGSSGALGATTLVTVSVGGTLDLNGQTTDRPLLVSGTGHTGGGGLSNSTSTSTTTGTLTGTVALGAVTTIGGAGNITINNIVGLTGTPQFTKIGAGTLTVISDGTANTRSGATQINAGTIRLESPLATGTPVGTGTPWILNGGTLSLGFNNASTLMTGAVTVNSSSTVISDVATLSNAAVIHTLGLLNFYNGSKLTVKTGANVAADGTQGMTFSTVSLYGNAAFDVQNSATATTRLTLGSLTDLAVAPRTITFGNSGTATTTSQVVLATAASLVDGTVVNINGGTNAGVNVNLNIATALGALAKVTVSGNSTITLGVTGVVFGSLAGDGTITGTAPLTTPTATTYTLTIGNGLTGAATASTFSGTFNNGTAGGLLGVTKAGTGTLTLGGSTSNTYTGATIVNTGTLVLAKTDGATSIGSTLTIGAAANGTQGNAIVRLDEDNQMIISAADVNNLTINAGGTLNLNGHTLTVNTLTAFFGSTITGSGTLVINRGGGTLSFAGANTISSSSTLQITTANSSSATRTVAVGGTAGAAGVTDVLTISGTITQGVNVGSIVAGNGTATAMGTLILSGTNSYTGLTTVSSGILSIRNGSALGTVANGTSVTSGGTLQIQGSITTLAEALTLNGSGFVGANALNYQTGAFVNVSGINNYAGLIALGSAATISSDSGTLNLTDTGTINGAGVTLTLAGAGNGSIASILGTTTGGLVKNGTGTWTLTGVNTNTGAITINAGVLKLGNGTTGRWSSAPGLTYTGSGTFEFGGSTAGSTQGLGALTLTSGMGTLQVDAPASGTNTVTFTSLAAPALGSGLNIVSPAGTSVTITGTASVNGVLDPRITYNGSSFAASAAGVISAAGTTAATSSLVAGNTSPYLINGSFAQTASVLVNAGIKFGASNTLTLNNTILLTINNGASAAGGILVAGGSTAVIANEGTAAGLTTGGSGDLVIRTDAAGDSLNIQVPITSSTTGGLTKTGAGTLTLSGASTYTGGTYINAGTLRLGNTAALSSSTATVQVGGVLDLNGLSILNTATLNGTGINNTGALINNSGTTASIGALTLGLGHGTGGIGASIGGTGNIISTGVLAGNSMLVKVGTGTVTFGDNAGTAQASTRSGIIRVDGGTLRVSNSPTALGAATSGLVLNGGTLSLGSAGSVAAYPTTVAASSTIISDIFAAGIGQVHTLGVLSIGTQTLTVKGGANVTTAGTNAGLTFGITTLLGSPTFDVQSPSTATGGTTTLTLGALNDQGVAKTLTFTNSGSATTNSVVTLATAMGSLTEGTIVNLNGGTNAGVTLNLNVAAALGTLAQVSVNGNSVLSLGVAQTIASLSGNGNVIGAFVLTVGNANSASPLTTTYSGTFGAGGVGTGLTKAGLGTLSLTGTNAYTGATLVSGGILKLGSTAALGATSGVTISSGGTVDLNGFSTGVPFTGLNSTGISSGGAVINTSTTTGTLTGAVALTGHSSIGGSGNILINNTTGITGAFQLTKVGSGTLTIIDTTTTSTRSGANQLDAGILRLQSAALTAVSPLGTGAWTINGGTLSLGFDTANALMTGLMTLNGSATVITDVATLNNPAVLHTMGGLTVNNNSKLTLKAGSNVASGGTQGLAFGTVLLNGNATFDVQSTATVTGQLTLGTMSDLAIAPRTITFQNTSSAASSIILGVGATSLVDGTVVAFTAGGGGMRVSLNAASVLGTLAQVTVGTGNTLVLGAAQTFGSLAGGGTVNGTGLFTLTLGNPMNTTAYTTDFSGTLGNGTGTLALTKTGLSTQTLSGSNSYTGATTVTLGVLKLGSSTALGATSAVSIGVGGTVDLNGQASDRGFTSISGTGHNGMGALINSSTTTAATITGPTVLGAAAKMGGAGDLLVSNAGGLTGNLLLTKTGAGMLTFASTAASTRTGANQIDEGTLRLQAATVLSPLGTGNMVLNGGTLSLGFDASGALVNLVNVLADSGITVDRATSGPGGLTQALGAVVIAGSKLTVKAGGNATSGTMGLTLGTITIGGPSLAPGNPTFDVQSTASATATLTLGALSDQAIGPRTITFQNSGVGSSSVTLATAATSLVNGTLINLAKVAGADGTVTLNVNHATAIGTFAQVTVGAGNTLSLGASQTVVALNGAGAVTATTDAVLTIGNPLSTSTENSTFTGTLDGMSLSVVKTGTGTLTLGGSASNTFAGVGGLAVNGGTVVLAKTGGALAVATNLSIGTAGAVNGPATVRLAGNEQIDDLTTVTMYNASTLDLNGNSETVASLAGAPGATLLNNATGTTASLTVGVADLSSVYLGAIVDNSAGTGTVALTKVGMGNFTLGGQGAYSGATQVQGGALQVGVNGMGATGTGAVTLSTGAALLGTGVVRGSSFTADTGSYVFVGDGTQQADYGTLSFIPASGATGTIDFQEGSNIMLGINPATGVSDLLAFTGSTATTLKFNGNLTVTADAFVPSGSVTFNLLDWVGLTAAPEFASRYNYTGNIYGNGDEAAGLDLPDVSNTGYFWDISNLTINGTILLAPEPSRMMLLGLALAMLLGRRRRC